MMRGVVEACTRWRHKHGYGVQSPFAYRLLNNVIRRGRHAYYAYPQILHAIKSDDDLPFLKREAFMLHRLAARFPFSKACIVSPHADVLKGAVSLADSRVKFCERPVDASSPMLAYVASAGGDDARWVVELACRYGSVVMLRDCDPALVQELCESVDRGLVFHNRRDCLVVPRRDMQKSVYLLKL